MKRIEEIDFAKGVLILLMVLFHLSFFVEHCPKGVCQCVYSFHMSGFLLMSGFLFNPDKELRKFLCGLRSIAVPYVVFMVVYLCSIGLLGKMMGSNTSIDFSGENIVGRIIDPASNAGTYWYLHTIVVGYCVYYLIHRFLGGINGIIITFAVLFLLSMFLGSIKSGNILFFAIGMLLRYWGNEMMKFIVPSFLSLVSIIVLVCFNDDYSRFSIFAVCMTMSVLSFLFALCNLSCISIRNVFCWLGRNSLGIVLFSPFFTIVTKMYIPLFSFDNTSLTWAFFSLILIVAMCLLSSKLFDLIKLSNIIVGKKIYQLY